MRLTNVNEVENFLRTVDQCAGDVYLASPYGDRYNLKSRLNRYIAVEQLINESGDELELYCTKREDEQLFFKFFKENPNV